MRAAYARTASRDAHVPYRVSHVPRISYAPCTHRFTIPRFSSLELVGAVKAFEGFTREAPLSIKRERSDLQPTHTPRTKPLSPHTTYPRT